MSATSNTDIRSVYSRAPTRIDLAGGTVDLWPLYLFLQHPVTLNLGIDLYAEARLEVTESRMGGQITLRSEDQNVESVLPWGVLRGPAGSLAPSGFQIPPQLELHFKLLRYFEHHRAPGAAIDLTLSTRARSPAGAGLGGSSTLSIAMIGALATWASGHVVDPIKDGEKFIEVTRDVETTVIQVPAGVQDYYGAMYGGLQSLRWGAGSHQREHLPSDILTALEERILLFYSGQSRNSGINNWALFKGFIDKQEGVRQKFEQIISATQKLETALRHRKWDDAGTAIAEEWSVRRTLAPGISTPEMDRAFESAQAAFPNYHLAGKVCGAGGGGCFFVYLPGTGMSSAELKEARHQVQDIFVQNGMRSLPFHAVPRGLEVQVNGA